MGILLRLLADPVMLLSRWTLDKPGAYAEKRTALRTGSTRVLIPDRLAKVTPLDLPDPSGNGVPLQPSSWIGCLGCLGCLSAFILLFFLSVGYWYIVYLAIIAVVVILWAIVILVSFVVARSIFRSFTR